MRILYGVSGEGFGHSSRAERVINYLRERGNEVLVMTYGQTYPILEKLGAEKINGVKVYYKENKLALSKTLFFYLVWVAKSLKNWFKLKERIREFNPDVCISDMEPLTPRMAHSLNVPVISLDNQHIIMHNNFKPEKNKKDFFVTKLTVKSCVKNPDKVIVLHYEKARSRNKNVLIVDPILRDEVLKLKPTKKNKILVYLSKQDKEFLSILAKLKGKFVVYGFGLQKENTSKNLVFKDIGKHFLKDLEDCKAIISNAGFSLTSEAFYLKKPYFAMPLKGQYEQFYNSQYLKKKGFGDFSESPKKEEIENFLKNLKRYEKNLKGYSIDPDKSLKEIEKTLKSLKRD